MFKPSERPEREADNATTAVTESTPVTPTLTHYQQVADQVSAALDSIVAVLPALDVPHPTTARFVRSHLNVPVAFLEAAVAGVAEKKTLQVLNKLDVVFGRDTIQMNQAFRPIVEKLHHFADNLKYTLDSRLALLTADALQIYHVAKGLGRDANGADMLQLARVLRENLGRRGPKKPVKAALPLPAVAADLPFVVAEPRKDAAAEPAPAIKKRRVRGKEADEPSSQTT